MAPNSYIIAGLGNPGTKYDGTRHNIGFEVADAFARDCGATDFQAKWDALICRIALGDATVHVVKPMTFMNRSGKAVAKCVDFYKVPIDHLLVIHDDIDMHTARLKLVKGGGTGGHNGIRSLVDCLGDNDFYRLKIGIGRPGRDGVPAEIPVERYVLMRFDEEEKERIDTRVGDLLAGLRRYLEGDSRGAINYLNSFK